MKQVIQSLRTGKLGIDELPPPSLKPEGLLVQTASSLVSAGTERMVAGFAQKSIVGKARSRPDLVRQVIDKVQREGLISTVNAVLNRLDSPLPLGYSAAGIVVAVGDQAKGFNVGDRVACAGGGYASHAEMLYIPKNLAVKLPGNVDFDEAAFTTLGAIALQGIRLAEVSLSENIGVIGLGLLGQLTIQMLKAAGARVLGVDIDPGRVKLAQELGANLAVVRAGAEAAAQTFSAGRGLDAVLITADTPSNDPVELAGAISRDKGRVVAVGAVGMTLPRKIYYEKELEFHISRSYGPGRYDADYEDKGRDYPYGYVRWTEGRNMEAFVHLLSIGQVQVKPLITHRFPIDQGHQAYELITGKTHEPFLGVVLTYDCEKKHSTQVSLPAAVHKPSAVVKIGLLGAGNFINATLLPALKGLPDIDFVSIASGTGVSAQHLGRKYGFRYAVSSEEDILTNPDINCVIIATRHHLHAAQTIRALQVGKHVFVEKPLALNEAELKEVTSTYLTISAANAQQAPYLMVGFNRRYAPLVVKLKAFLAQINEPLIAHYRINAGYIPSNHWVQDLEQGGGRIVGEVCHFVDLLQYLIGSMPRRVCAATLPNQGKYNNDNLSLTVEFENGSIGTVLYTAAGDKAFGKEQLELFGGGRIAVLTDFRKLQLVENGRWQKHQLRLQVDKGHRGEWETLIAAIKSGGDNPIPLIEMVASSLVTYRVLQSLAEQQPVYIDTANFFASAKNG
ncbi:MAG: bi-domain-containing oxidoreductase [Chloroflexota bacterium]